MSQKHSLPPLFTHTHARTHTELRKDKAERAPGGVTPGEDPAYYAAVARAQQPPSSAAAAAAAAVPNARERSPLRDRDKGGSGSRPRTPSRLPDFAVRPAVCVVLCGLCRLKKVHVTALYSAHSLHMPLVLGVCTCLSLARPCDQCTRPASSPRTPRHSTCSVSGGLPSI